MDANSNPVFKPYITEANEAIELKLVRNEEDLFNEETTFKPDMSHQVFGEKEIIFGYQDLKIQLFYTAGSLKTYIGMDHKGEIPQQLRQEMQPDNVLQKIMTWVPEEYIYYLEDFIHTLQREEEFKPEGELLSTFTIHDGEDERYFEVYKGNMQNRLYRKYHQRLRTFAIWYIDAANFVDIDDENWLFFNLYEKYQNKNGVTCYATVGFSHIYLYYAYPQHVRPRIAQFLILPPFQIIGLGAQLLREIYKYFVKDSKVTDITVEDPSQTFQRVRDFVDCINVRNLPSFSTKNLMNGFNKIMVQEAKEKLKINKRQARRIYEILRLYETDVSNEDEYRKYRLDIKRRLNVPFHREQKNIKKIELAMQGSMDKHGHHCTNKSMVLPSLEQRIQTLDIEYRFLEDEYNRVINRLKRNDDN